MPRQLTTPKIDKYGNLPIHTYLYDTFNPLLSDLESLTLPGTISLLQTSPYGEFALHIALKRHDIDNIVMKLIELSPEVVSLKNQLGNFAIHVALSEFDV